MKLPNAHKLDLNFRILVGAQCRMIDWRQRGCAFEPHRRHCVVSLSKTHLSLLSTGSTEEDPSLHN